MQDPASLASSLSSVPGKMAAPRTAGNNARVTMIRTDAFLSMRVWTVGLLSLKMEMGCLDCVGLEVNHVPRGYRARLNT